MPGTAMYVMYVYLGPLAKAVTGERAQATGESVLEGAGLPATIAATTFLTRFARKALTK